MVLGEAKGRHRYFSGFACMLRHTHVICFKKKTAAGDCAPQSKGSLAQADLLPASFASEMARPWARLSNKKENQRYRGSTKTSVKRLGKLLAILWIHSEHIPPKWANACQASLSLKGLWGGPHHDPTFRRLMSTTDYSGGVSCRKELCI